MPVGQPKKGGSWWRDLTECGPLEKGMANHFSILALRTPWTVWKSESEVAQSCPSLSDPMDWSPAGSSIYGIFQARVLEWGAIAFSVKRQYCPLTWNHPPPLNYIFFPDSQCSKSDSSYIRKSYKMLFTFCIIQCQLGLWKEGSEILYLFPV